MKIVFILLLSVGVVWSVPPQPNAPQETEMFEFHLTPWQSKVVEVDASVDVETDKIDPKVSDRSEKPTPAPTQARPASTTTTTAPVAQNSVPIDLSQRLFFANNRDSQFGRKTLDLSGLDLSGEDVMKILHGLNASTLSSVARLDLSHNRVWGLPSRVWPLPLEYGLRELRLDHNRLDMYDPGNRRATRFELLRLLSLKKLSLSHCGLTTGDSSVTLEYPPIESLDLSGNQLVDLPSSLATLATLRHLDVSGNNLRYLGRSPLCSLTGLQTLNLSHNGMERMWDDPLVELFSLETLHLDHNSLTEPPRLYQFSGSYQPRMDVSLSGNTFRCGCAFKNTLDIGRVQVVDKSNVTCVDDDGVEWSVDSAPATRCSPLREAVRGKWSGAKEWVQDHRPDWSTLCRSLGWVLFGVTLGLVYAHRRSKKTLPPSQVPYNILDDRANTC